MLFFFMYLVTLSGNVTIITIICVDWTLHMPMYRFLALLSLSETCYTLVIIPNMLVHLLMDSQAISIAGCWAQMFFFLSLDCSHCFLLTLMGYTAIILVVLVSFLLTLLSYAFIVAAIVRIPLAVGRHKAFSTCAAHHTVVTVYFGCAFIIYLWPESGGNPGQDRLVLPSTRWWPLLNPVVYTLHNKERPKTEGKI
ncbi:olfactory receptor 10T2-like [Saccopteryx leptura]|uniref:olfactory receptor 10T2-like n=1 Tax=Saccopteryx leptura TaxID=249018 RepID=UPI00339C6F44